MNGNKTAEEYLNKIPMWTKKKNSLEDIRRFLNEMGDPDDRMKILHVAGTNGKGSVCAFLQSALINSGYRVGTFTSPHLVDIRERISMNGEMVSESVFSESWKRIKELSEGMMEKGFCHPSYFEFLFYMAIDIFSRSELDYIILETGMGGRLDTTNVISHPLVSIITSISFDHMQYLGDTIEKIAGEKAGIIKPGVPVVFDGNNEDAAKVIISKAKEMETSFDRVDRGGYEIMEFKDKGYVARLSDISGDSLEFFIPSYAEYQAENAMLAFHALRVLGFPKREDMVEGFSKMSWPARMEEVIDGVFLDGAHNTSGMEAFIQAADRLCRTRKKKAILLFSAVADKEHDLMIKKLVKALPLHKVAVAHLHSERGTEIEILLKEFQESCKSQIIGCDSMEESLLSMLKQRDESCLIFCVGSLYLMGEIKEVLRRNGYDKF